MNTNSKPTPYQLLDMLTDEQLDVLLSVDSDELNKMLVDLTYARVAKRLWANRPVIDMKGNQS